MSEFQADLNTAARTPFRVISGGKDVPLVPAPTAGKDTARFSGVSASPRGQRENASPLPNQVASQINAAIDCVIEGLVPNGMAPWVRQRLAMPGQLGVSASEEGHALFSLVTGRPLILGAGQKGVRTLIIEVPDMLGNGDAVCRDTIEKAAALAASVGAEKLIAIPHLASQHIPGTKADGLACPVISRRLSNASSTYSSRPGSTQAFLCFGQSGSVMRELALTLAGQSGFMSQGSGPLGGIAGSDAPEQAFAQFGAMHVDQGGALGALPGMAGAALLATLDALVLLLLQNGEAVLARRLEAAITDRLDDGVVPEGLGQRLPYPRIASPMSFAQQLVTAIVAARCKSRGPGAQLRLIAS